MDCDIVRKRNRFGRMVTTLAVLPDADISDNDVEDTENNNIQSDSESDSDTGSDSNAEEFQITESGDSTNCWSRMRNSLQWGN